MTCKECDKKLENQFSVCLCEMSDEMLGVTLECASIAAGLGDSKMVDRVEEIEAERRSRIEYKTKRLMREKYPDS